MVRQFFSRLIYESSDDHMNDVNMTTHMKQEIRGDVSNGMRFNDGQLPLWVTKSVHEDATLVTDSSTRKMMPKGRWAQRVTPFSQDGILHIPSGILSVPGVEIETKCYPWNFSPISIVIVTIT